MSGCAGMLGDAFYRIFKNNYKIKCTDINIQDEWISFLDFRNYKEYYKDVITYNPDYLFHIGAHTDLEFCEKNKDDTYKTNIISVEHATSIVNKLDIPLLYISTAGIFDGNKDYYDENDIPNPIGQYAKSKYAAELFVQKNCKKYLICRAGWMMGGGPKKDKKFVHKIINQIISGKKELYIVDDKFGTPTYTIDFAKNVEYLIKNNIQGLFNLVCEGNSSRLEVAKEIIKILDLNKKIKIHKVNSNHFKNLYFVPRPNSEMLINKKLNDKSMNIMRNWKICLKEYLDEFYNGIK